MKVHLVPDVAQVDPGTGIGRVVIAQYEHLPEFGIELVPEARKADVIAVHTQPMGREYWDVCHCHGLYWTGDPGSGIYTHWHDEINKRLIDTIRKSKIVTVPSRWVAKPFQRDLRIDPVVVGHGIKFTEWAPGENKGFLLWNKNRNTDVCDPMPSWELANRGLPIVSTFAPDVEFSDLSNYKITGRMPFEKMKIVISQADVYLGTTKETFGIGILEAMACGVPVLGYAHGGIVDLVDHEVDGYLVEPGDINGLVEGYEWIKDRRSAMSEAARSKAKRYDWPNVIEKYADVYRLAAYPESHGVSVVIPCHNYGGWIADCVDSVLKQSQPVNEIIVVDDGSSDNSLQVLNERYGNNIVVKIIAQENQGVAAARNNGILASSQPFIICVDADDMLDPSMVKVCRDAMIEDRSLGIAYTGLSLIRTWGLEPYTAWPPEFDWETQARPHNPPQNCVPSGSMFRREMYDRAGGYRQAYAPGEDAEFWTRGLSTGFTARKITNEGLFHYRLHANSESRNNKYKTIDAWLPWMRDKEFPIGAPTTGTIKVRSYSSPVVSVIIPVGAGHEKYLESALECLLGQTYREWEVIVINDSFEALDLQRFPFVRHLQTQGGQGAGAARNLGIAAAKAPAILFLDVDDYLMPNALDLMLDKFAISGGRYVYSDWIDDKSDHKAPEYDLKLFENLLPHAVTTIIATEDAKKIEFDETLETWEDWDFYIRCAINGIHGRRLPVPLLYYRNSTGKRRQLATGERRPRLHKQIKKKYRKYFTGAIEMAGCCGGTRAAKNILEAKRNYAEFQGRSEAINMMSEIPKDGTIRLEYIGQRTGAVTYFGKRKQYRFGNNASDRFNDVNTEDAEKLLGVGDFRIVNRAPAAAEQQTDYIPEPIEAEPAAEPEPEPEAKTIINATPKAVQLAAQYSIDLENVDGSGKSGRIGVADVRKYAREYEGIR